MEAQRWVPILGLQRFVHPFWLLRRLCGTTVGPMLANMTGMVAQCWLNVSSGISLARHWANVGKCT